MDLGDPLHRPREQGETLQGVVLGLQGDEHLPGGDEGVDRHNPQTRRAVDEDVVQPGQAAPAPAEQVVAKRLAELGLASGGVDELDLHGGDVDRRGQAPQVLGEARLRDDVLDARALDQHVVDRGVLLPVLHAQSRGGVALRVRIDDEDMEAALGERRGDIDRRRRLADTALLVRDGDHPSLLGARKADG